MKKQFIYFPLRISRRWFSPGINEKKKFLQRGSYRGKGIAVFTSGGDSQGMNAAVRAVVRVGIYLGCKMYFIHEGYQGMVDGGKHIQDATWSSVSSIIHKGGTVIGSARCKEFRERSGRLKAAKNLVTSGISNIVCIGGDGSLTGANLFRKEWPSLLEELTKKGEISEEEAKKFSELRIVGIVGSIDNDFWGADMTVGADSALHRISEAIDAIVSTASSHQRTFILEVMGRHCGYLCVASSLGSEADYVFIPEAPAAANWEDQLAHKIESERKEGKRLNIVIVAEGAVDQNGKSITSDQVKNIIVEKLGLDARVTILGHVQRGGNPSAFDRVLGCRMGGEAVLALLESTEASEPVVVTLEGNQAIRLPLMECVTKTQAVSTAMANKEWEKAVELRGPHFRRHLEAFKKLARLKPPAPPTDSEGYVLGVMHIGAPSCGMNPAVRAFVKNSLYRGDKVIGIHGGIDGLIAGEFSELEWTSVNGWVHEGGAILGTKRTLPSKHFDKVAEQLAKHKIQGLAIIGGFEAYKGALEFIENRPKYNAFRIPICVIPSTISNNVPGTDFSLGADSALNEITEICDRIRQSAQGTKRRVFIIETMGGYCGYLATLAGLAGGADAAYIFEEKFSIKDLEQDLRHMASKMAGGVMRGLILRNENANVHYTTDFITRLYQEEGKGFFTTRSNILGHMQQGGRPSPFDRNFGTKMGTNASDWLFKQLKGAGIKKDSPPSMDTKDSVIMMGLVKKFYVNTPVLDLVPQTDFENRIPKQNWWMKFRPLLRVLAKHESVHDEPGIYMTTSV